MRRANVSLTVLAGLVVLAGADANWVSRATLAAQAPQANTRSLPTFEVDRAWPRVPAKWKLGDPSSFAVDAQDRVWLLQIGRASCRERVYVLV